MIFNDKLLFFLTARESVVQKYLFSVCKILFDHLTFNELFRDITPKWIEKKNFTF